MAVALAARLLQEAQSGSRKLTTSERRHCIQYIAATAPDTTNSQMSEWFQVSDRTIRVDKGWIRKQKARFLKEELSNDMALVIADIAMDFEKQVMDIEKSKQKCKLGQRAYVDHCTSIFDMRLKMVKAFQDIGYLPKNLGSMTVDKFEYKAVVSTDGAVSTRRMDMFEDNKPTEAVDVEFEDVTPAALPEKTTNEQNEVAAAAVHAAVSDTTGNSE